MQITPKSEEMPKVIVVENLSFSYEDSLILDNVSLSIDAGEFIGIIGPNGGGKTTFLKLLMGLLKPTKGLIEVFGCPSKMSRTKIGYVPQVMRCDRNFPISVLELVLGGRLSRIPWWGRFQDSDKTAALNAIERVGLSELWNRPFGTLSGGQAQRALIARAIASEPELLLLDEPTASVDTVAEADIHGILKELSATITILMVTHDLKDIVNQLQRVYCFQRQVTSLTPEQLCEHFAMGLYHPPVSKPVRFAGGL